MGEAVLYAQKNPNVKVKITESVTKKIGMEIDTSKSEFTFEIDE